MGLGEGQYAPPLHHQISQHGVIMPEIRLAITPEERHAVYRLRYDICIEEMQQPVKTADHSARTLTDSLDVPGVTLLAAWHEGQVVGTARTNYLRNCVIGNYVDFYSLGALTADTRAVTSISTRIMVRADFRGTTLAAHLASHLYRQALADGILFDYCDCHVRLLPWYTGLGYKLHRLNAVHDDYGNATVLRLDIQDLVHLEYTQSPFRGILRANRDSTCSVPSEFKALPQPQFPVSMGFVHSI